MEHAGEACQEDGYELCRISAIVTVYHVYYAQLKHINFIIVNFNF